VLTKSVAEPVHEQAEGVDREACLLELRRLLGQVQSRELEEPVAMVRHYVLCRGGRQMLGDLEQLFLGRQVLLPLV